MPAGVIPKNENKTEEMTLILKELHTYVPLDKTGKQIAIGFGGDQLQLRDREFVKNCMHTRWNLLNS